MLWTLLAILALVVTGGFISYYGDLQGRRWGKKRVSWFGLRPKHTAILITSLTGAGIAFLTVLAVMIAAPNIRHVILHGEAAINANRIIQAESRRQTEALERELKNRAGQIAELESTRQSMIKQMAGAKAETDAQKATNAQLEAANDGLGQKNMDMQRTQAALKRGIETNRVALARMQIQTKHFEIQNRDLAQQNTRYGRQNDLLEHDNVRLLATNASLKESSAKLKTYNDTLVSANINAKMSFVTANKSYNQQLDDYAKLQEEYGHTREDYQSFKEKFASLKGQYDALVQQRDQMSDLLAGTSRDFVQQYLALRNTRYNLRADTELARRTLDAHLSPKATKDELMSLLKDASDRARRYGAAVGENGRTVKIVSKRVVTPASVTMADESASVNAIVDAVAGSNTPVVVIARAINNTSADEQVLVELTSYASTTVFKPGTVVASTAIDTRQPMDKLVQSVISFLKQDVRNAALKSGTIPQNSPDTGEEEIGIIDTPEMVTLVDRIRRTGGTVQLTAVANEPITSADLLTFGQSRGGDKPHNRRFDLKRVTGRLQRPGEPIGG